MSRILITYFLILTTYVSIKAQSEYSQFIKQNNLKNTRIILLGEPDHYSTMEMEEKVKMIKYLHDSLDYNILAFESSIYDMWKANEMLKNGKDTEKSLYSGIFPIWHYQEPLSHLANYLGKTYQTNKPITLTGFDSQIASGIHTKDSLIPDLFAFLNEKKINPPPSFRISLEKEVKSFCSSKYTITNKFNPELLDDLILIAGQLSKFSDKNSLRWKQILYSMQGQFYDHYINNINLKTDTSFHASNSNLRDSLMANNLISLIKQYPNEKIICWGATYHFANQIQKLSLPSDKSFEYAKPMGYYLKKQFGEQVSIIGFSDIQNLDTKREDFIEDVNLSSNKVKFVDFSKTPPKEQYSAFLGHDKSGNYPFGSWKNALDYGIIIGTKKTSIRGVIMDEQEQVIPFAHIYIKHTNIGVIANKNGEFLLKLSKNDTLIISSMGYEPKELLLKDFKNEYQKITLEMSDTWLDEVVVTANQNEDKKLLFEVVKKAQNHFPKKTLTMEVYDYSKWHAKESPKENFINEGVIVFDYYDMISSRFPSYHILNKRNKNNKKPIIPFPMIPLSSSNFENGQRFLHKKAYKNYEIDSITTNTLINDTLVTIYYHHLNPKLKNTGSLFKKYYGNITFLSNSLKITNESYTYSREDDGLQKIEGYIYYTWEDDTMYPTYAKMSFRYLASGLFKHLEDKKLYEGENRLFFIPKKSQSLPKPEKRVIEYKDAPYNKSFWKNYNAPYMSNSLDKDEQN